jgi:hypothetical protein
LNPDPDTGPAFQVNPDPDQGFDRKNEENKIQLFFFNSEIAFYLSLGLHKGCPSYKRSLQPSKKNIQHFIFAFWIRIRIANPDPDTVPENPLNPDPQHKKTHQFKI